VIKIPARWAADHADGASSIMGQGSRGARQEPVINEP
jgi:hypothetical protein